MGKDIETQKRLDGLVELVKALRGEHGCPWDRAQTAEKIEVYLIEEAYEVLDAIDSNDADAVCGELGDLLFHIVFLAQIFKEAGAFDMNCVIDGIQDKMIRRHPHVFGDSKVSGVGDVKAQWQKIKAKEKKEESVGHFDSVPVALPAMLRAYRLGERAARIGLDARDLDAGWRHVANAYEYFVSESKEGGGDKKSVAAYYGELLFSLIRLGRVMDIHPENALSQTTVRFLRRCRHVEGIVTGRGKTFDSLSQEEISDLWEASKSHEVSPQ